MSAPAELLRGSVGLPWETPAFFECPAGYSIAEIVDELIEQGKLDASWSDGLDVYLNEQVCPREMWSRVRPRVGCVIALRGRPGWTFLVQLAINVAISAGVSALMQAFVGSGPQQQSFDPLRTIDSSRNEVAPWRKVPVPLGEMRVWPPHASKAYTQGADEKVFLYMLLCWGLAPVSVKQLKIGDTPIEQFAGVQVQHKLKPGDPWPTLISASPDEDEGPGLMEFADGWVARTTTSAACDLLQVELAFVEGLVFYSGDGSLKTYGVNLNIRYREAGTSQWKDFVTGANADEGHLYVLEGYKKTKPFRMTFEKSVPRARYEVAVKRVWEDDPGPKGRNAFQWTKLRAFTFTPPVTDDNLAITALKIEASDQLDGVIDLVNGVVTRIAPRWDANTESFGAAAETANPAELLRWIVSGPGAALPRDPDTEIDDAAFGAWAELCAERGWRCDLELRAGAGQDDIMRLVAQCGRAVPIERDGLLTVVIDDVRPAPVQLFTPRNSWGFRSQRRYAAETHGLRCRFNNAEKDFAADEMIVYYPGFDANNADGGRILAPTIAGKTRPNEVREAALRIIAEDLLRPEDYSWRCDWENLACGFGDRVAISHFAIAVGRQAARVKGRTVVSGNVTALTLDEIVTQTAGDTYGLAWRRAVDGGFSVETFQLTNMANGRGRVVTLQTPKAEAEAPAVGDLVVFGDAGIETIDAVVQNMPRAVGLEAEISAVPYNPAIIDGDFEGLTDFSDDTTYSDNAFNQQDMGGWQSNVSRESYPDPPAPQVVNVNANAGGIYVDFTFPPADAWRVDKIECAWKRDEDDGVFELVRTLPGSARLAAFPAGQQGVGYVLQLTAISTQGRRVAGQLVFVNSASATLPFEGVLSQTSALVSTASDGSGGDYSNAGGVFRITIGGQVVSPIVGIDDAPAATFAVVSATPGLSIAIDAEGVFTVSALSVDTGQAVLRATRNGIALDLAYTIAKVRAGAPPAPPTPPSGFSATIDLAATSTGVSLRALADAAGYTGFSDATITFNVPTGVNVIGAPGGPNGGVGVDTGEWPHTEYDINITLVVKSGGQVAGGGGKAGNGGAYGNGAPGGNGGDAVNLRAPLTIDNQSGGSIRAGGGGGGGGGAARGRVPYTYADANSGGGGGGGGAPNGPGGGGGAVSGGHNGSPGVAGTALGGGGGGGAGFWDSSFVSIAGDGGDGGAFGAAGEVGANAVQGAKNKWWGGAAGAAGVAVRKNGFDLSMSGSGVVVGAVV